MGSKVVKASVFASQRKQEDHSQKKTKLRLFLDFFLFPALIFLILFYFFDPQYWGHFTKGFFLDQGDGFQNVWNVWWVDKAVIHLHQNPWFTSYLHWPEGITLLPQTLNPFNGFMVLPLTELFHMSLVQVVNVIVVFSFVMSGITMFWFIYYLNRSYVVAVFSGMLYTFSSYHFAHALGHMQLISMEWIPLFLLAWWRLLELLSANNKDKRRIIHLSIDYWVAIAAGLVLFLVMLCDYYYLFYSAMTAAIIALYFLIKKWVPITRHVIFVFAAFAGTTLVTVGPFLYKLSQLNQRDPLLGFHDPVSFGMDLLSPILPGGEWFFHNATKWFTGRLFGGYSETSIYFGLVIIGSLAAILFWRKKFALPKWINVWWIIFFTFMILALGPSLHFYGHIFHRTWLPYNLLTVLVPTLKISGMPVRMVIMGLISAIVITSFALKKINLSLPIGKLFFVFLFLLFCFDVYPSPLPLSSPGYPAYVTVLKKLPMKPGDGIVDNAADSSSLALYYQTIHQIPEAFGYTTRTPTSVGTKDFLLFADIEQNRQYKLCSVYHIRYLATQIYYRNGFPIIYQQPHSNVHIYDLKDGMGC